MSEDKYYMISEKVLPEIFKKVLKVKETLSSGKAKDVIEAVKQEGRRRRS